MSILKQFKNNPLIQTAYDWINPFMGTILMLHRVLEIRSEINDNRLLEITPSFLEQTILEYKKKGYHFVSVDEACQIQMSGSKLKIPYVCFTFDDGYRDNLTQAFPVFEKYQIPFTIYIATDFPDRKAFMWWYLLDDLLQHQEEIQLSDGITLVCRTKEQKNQVFQFIKKQMRENVHSDQRLFFNYLLCKYSKMWENKVPVDVLTWEDIKYLQNTGLCTIGSHGISHTSFTGKDNIVLRNELLESSKLIENQTGHNVQHLAYPFGDMNKHIAEVAKQCGYQSAVRIDGGMQRKNRNPFYFKRQWLKEE